MAVSDSLYLALSEALSQPSKKYRAAQEGLAIPRKVMEGYEYGAEFMDKQNQRKMDKQTLEEALGGNVPERVRQYGKLTVPLVKDLGGLKGLADITETKTAGIDNSPEELLAKEVREGRMTLKQAYDLKNSGALLRAGYSQGPGDTLNPVPGGKPSRDIQAEEIRKAEAKRQQNEKSRDIISAIDKSLSRVGTFTTGVPGAILKNVPATSAFDLDKTLNMVRANVGFETLADMRNSSPTHGALGQISDRENQLLQDARGSLDLRQGDDQLIDNLKKLRTHYSNVMLINDSQTGDPEADSAIAKIIESQEPEGKKRALISAVRSRAGR